MQLGFKAYWQAYLEDQVEGLLRDRDSAGSAKFGRTFVSFWMRGRIRSLAIGARGTESVTASTGPRTSALRFI